MNNFTDDTKKQHDEIIVTKTRAELLAIDILSIPTPIFEKCIGVTVLLLFLILMF